ncbi:MAG: gamma-glutamyltransferase [Alphaproteobacteria bacterium]
MSGTVSANWVKSVARLSIVMGVVGSLAACGLNPLRSPDRPRQIALDDHIGAVAVDEPVAATIAADILRDGGTAADAATAAYFALAVTYPTGAGLGGGGMCLYRERASNSFTTFEFMPAPTQKGGLSESPVPGSVAGMGALHEMAGALAWSEVLAPAEVLARSGYRASRARARATASLPPAFRGRKELDSLTKTAGGQKIEEGSELADAKLADTLLDMRSRGWADFYAGRLASKIVDGASQAGLQLSAADLQGYQAIVSGADRFSAYGSDIIIPNSSSSARRLLRAIIEFPEFRREARQLAPAGRADFARTIEERARKELGFGKIPVDARTGAASLAISDRAGNIAVCSYTTYGALGTGKMAGDTGFTFAGPIASLPAIAARLGLLPLLIDNGGVEIGTTVAGGPGAVAMLTALFSDQAVQSESDFKAAVRQSTHARGRSLNAVACTGGGGSYGFGLGLAPRRTRSADCVAETASAGFGLAINVYPD